MKKTYKNQLPKNMEVSSTNVRVENGEIIVDVEFKERFEPKDGDFCVSSYGKVFIYSEKPANDNFTYCAYCGEGRTGYLNAEFSYQWTNKKGCRFATPEEKADFLARLEKECGKRWNAETKQLEDIRWQPKHGETYWYVYEKFTVLEETYSKESNFDVNNARINNCFRTAEAAQKVADQIKEIFKNSKAE